MESNNTARPHASEEEDDRFFYDEQPPVSSSSSSKQRTGGNNISKYSSSFMHIDEESFFEYDDEEEEGHTRHARKDTGCCPSCVPRPSAILVVLCAAVALYVINITPLDHPSRQLLAPTHTETFTDSDDAQIYTQGLGLTADTTEPLSLPSTTTTTKSKTKTKSSSLFSFLSSLFSTDHSILEMVVHATRTVITSIRDMVWMILATSARSGDGVGGLVVMTLFLAFLLVLACITVACCNCRGDGRNGFSGKYDEDEDEDEEGRLALLARNGTTTQQPKQRWFSPIMNFFSSIYSTIAGALSWFSFDDFGNGSMSVSGGFYNHQGMYDRNVEGTPPEPGAVGLTNPNIMCYQNSALQCLSNVSELNEYFTSGQYREDLEARTAAAAAAAAARTAAAAAAATASGNIVTPAPPPPPSSTFTMGTNGEVTRALAALMRQLWKGKKVVAPVASVTAALPVTTTTTLTSTSMEPASFNGESTIMKPAAGAVAEGRTSVINAPPLASPTTTTVAVAVPKPTFKVIAPKKFRSIVGAHENRFGSHEQQDNSDFLVCLLNWLHEDTSQPVTCLEMSTANESTLNSSPSSSLSSLDDETLQSTRMWNQQQAKATSIVSKLFYGQQVFRTSCPTPGCGYVARNFDTTLFLPLPLPIATRTWRLRVVGPHLQWRKGLSGAALVADEYARAALPLMFRISLAIPHPSSIKAMKEILQQALMKRITAHVLRNAATTSSVSRKNGATPSRGASARNNILATTAGGASSTSSTTSFGSDLNTDFPYDLVIAEVCKDGTLVWDITRLNASTTIYHSDCLIAYMIPKLVAPAPPPPPPSPPPPPAAPIGDLGEESASTLQQQEQQPPPKPPAPRSTWLHIIHRTCTWNIHDPQTYRSHRQTNRDIQRWVNTVAQYPQMMHARHAVPTPLPKALLVATNNTATAAAITKTNAASSAGANQGAGATDVGSRASVAVTTTSSSSSSSSQPSLPPPFHHQVRTGADCFDVPLDPPPLSIKVLRAACSMPLLMRIVEGTPVHEVLDKVQLWAEACWGRPVTPDSTFTKFDGGGDGIVQHDAVFPGGDIGNNRNNNNNNNNMLMWPRPQSYGDIYRPIPKITDPQGERCVLCNENGCSGCQLLTSVIQPEDQELIEQDIAMQQIARQEEKERARAAARARLNRRNSGGANTSAMMMRRRNTPNNQRQQNINNNGDAELDDEEEASQDLNVENESFGMSDTLKATLSNRPLPLRVRKQTESHHFGMMTIALDWFQDSRNLNVDPTTCFAGPSREYMRLARMRDEQLPAVVEEISRRSEIVAAAIAASAAAAAADQVVGADGTASSSSAPAAASPSIPSFPPLYLPDPVSVIPARLTPLVVAGMQFQPQIVNISSDGRFDEGTGNNSNNNNSSSSSSMMMMMTTRGTGAGASGADVQLATTTTTSSSMIPFSNETAPSRMRTMTDADSEATLHTCFGLYSATSTLSAGNLYSCPRCNQKVPAKCSTALVRMPEVLVLTLKRFVHVDDMGTMEKLDTLVKFPLFGLDLCSWVDTARNGVTRSLSNIGSSPSFSAASDADWSVYAGMTLPGRGGSSSNTTASSSGLNTTSTSSSSMMDVCWDDNGTRGSSSSSSSSSAPPPPPIYDLFAVSHHMGTLHQGHYIAYAANAVSGRWYKFDDYSVTPVIPEPPATTSNAGATAAATTTTTSEGGGTTMVETEIVASTKNSTTTTTSTTTSTTPAERVSYTAEQLSILQNTLVTPQAYMLFYRRRPA